MNHCPLCKTLLEVNVYSHGTQYSCQTHHCIKSLEGCRFNFITNYCIIPTIIHVYCPLLINNITSFFLTNQAQNHTMVGLISPKFLDQVIVYQPSFIQLPQDFFPLVTSLTIRFLKLKAFT